MSKFSPGKVGDWVMFCDICGQKWYASEMTKLDTDTGRGGLIVCPFDADKVDYGLIPYVPEVERPIPYTRINHTSTTNHSSVVDPETSTDLGV